MSAHSAAPGQHVCVCPPGNGGYLQETTSESSWEVGGQGPIRQSGCAVKMTACLVSATGWATGTSWAPASDRKAPSRHALSLHLLLFFGLTRFVNVQCCALLDHACSSAFIVCVCVCACVYEDSHSVTIVVLCFAIVCVRERERSNCRTYQHLPRQVSVLVWARLGVFPTMPTHVSKNGIGFESATSG